MTDWSWPCVWFAEAARHQAEADALRSVGRHMEASNREWIATYKEQIGMGGVDGQREAIKKGYA